MDATWGGKTCLEWGRESHNKKLNDFFVNGGYIMSNEEKNRLSHHLSMNLTGQKSKNREKEKKIEKRRRKIGKRGEKRENWESQKRKKRNCLPFFLFLFPTVSHSRKSTQDSLNSVINLTLSRLFPCLLFPSFCLINPTNRI